MISNPIVQRELLSILRTRKAVAAQVALALVFTVLIIARWPTDARVDLSGSQSEQMFRVFAYGLFTSVLLLVPIFPATSIAREKSSGTLALLLNSPLKPWSIYFGKLFATIGFVLILLAISLPAAATCYAMGGINLAAIGKLYGLLLLIVVQYSALALLISSLANSTESAQRITYGLLVAIVLVAPVPHQFLQGKAGLFADTAAWLRCLSPVPLFLQVVGQGDLGGGGFVVRASVAQRFFALSVGFSIVCMVLTMLRLNHRMLDRSRSQGQITDERSSGIQWFRRMFFLVDPQRRKKGIARFVNPVMVKEFRCRRFGRTHWMLRLVAVCALVSLAVTYYTTTGTMDWGVETIGGMMVFLQVALMVLLTPSLAAGLITTERESGGWALLQMTPLSAGAILRGKLMSVVWPLTLILFSTLPGYIFMVYIKPEMLLQIYQVMICLALTAVFAMLLSAVVGNFFSRTSVATAVAYGALIAVCAGTMLFWLARNAPFGHSTVQAALSINPLAAALHVIATPGFEDYELIPLNWYITGTTCVLLFGVLILQTRRYMRPA